MPTIRSHQPKRAGQKLLPVPLVVSGVAVGMLVAFGLAMWSLWGKQRVGARSSGPAGAKQVVDRSAPPKARRKALPAGPSAKPAVEVNRGEQPASASDRADDWRPRGPQTMADLMDQPDGTAADAGTVAGRLASARQAMWSRDLDAARTHLEAAIQAAGSPGERSQAERVQRLLELLETFWQAVRQAAAGLDSGQELKIGDTWVMVVEARGGSLTVRAAGRNLTYPVDDLPRQLAVALAELNLPQGQPATDLCIGSFQAIDARGDRHEAYVRWERAGAEGKALLSELPLAPPPRGVGPPRRTGEPKSTRPNVPLPGNRPNEPLQEKPARSGALPGGADGGPPGQPDRAAQPPVAEKLPVPDHDAHTQAEQEIRELFGQEIENARTADDKLSLANRLLDIAVQTDDDPAARYVLSRMARDLAVQAGDPGCFCRSIDEMDRHYQVDALAMKAQAISEAWGSQQSRPYRKALADESLKLLDAAMTAKHYAAAEQLVRVAQSGARAAKDYRLMRELDERARQIKAALRAGQ